MLLSRTLSLLLGFFLESILSCYELNESERERLRVYQIVMVGVHVKSTSLGARSNLKENFTLYFVFLLFIYVLS